MSEADTVSEIEFDAAGLVPVVAQDTERGEVLTLAYANAAAITHTLETGLAHYYSRSREELWQKGATSGHVQHVEEVRIDCDGDALLYSVSQEGGACHTGYETCFYRSIEDVSTVERERTREATGASNDTERLVAETRVVADRVFDPETVYDT